MTSAHRPLDPSAFEQLCEQLAVASVRCSNEQLLDLADSLHAALRRRRRDTATTRLDDEQRSWMD